MNRFFFGMERAFMDPRLDTFLTLCRTMHYGRAAEALNLSQPAVSKHIQALEAQYGAKLFDYSGRRLSQDESGRAAGAVCVHAALQRGKAHRRNARPAGDAAAHRRDEIHRRLHPAAGDSAVSERAGQSADLSGGQHRAAAEPAGSGRAGLRGAGGHLRQGALRQLPRAHGVVHRRLRPQPPLRRAGGAAGRAVPRAADPAGGGLGHAQHSGAGAGAAGATARRPSRISPWSARSS